jgi:multiple sugar transport system substrate-binding protein
MANASAFTRRRLLGGALGAAALGTLAACGSNSGTGSQTAGGGSTTASVPLAQWYHQYGEAGTQEAAKKYAASYKDAKVTIQWIPGDYDAKLTSGLSSGSGPDAFEGHLSRSLVASGQIVALDDLIADVKDDYDPSDLVSSSIDGKLYALPMIIDPQMIYYSKEALAAKGITAIVDLGGMQGPAIFSTGGTFLTEDKKVGFDVAKVSDVLVKLRTLAQSKSLLLGNDTDWWDPTALNDGLCAMQWQGMWAVPGMTEALGADGIGAFPFPAASASDGKPAVVKGGWQAFVNAKSAHVDEAKAFTKWLWVDNLEDQEDWCLNYGFHIPPRKSLAAKAEKLQSGVAAESVKLNTDHGIANSPEWTPAMQTALSDAVTRIVGKNADPEKELNAAVKKINSELAKIG